MAKMCSFFSQQYVRQITKSTKSKINLNIELKRQNSQAKLFLEWAKSWVKQTDQQNIRDKLQGINLTAETMPTNMSPLTGLDMHDQLNHSRTALL